MPDFEQSIEEHEWLTLEIASDESGNSIALNKTNTINNSETKINGSTLINPTKVTFGSENARGAHFRVCNVHIVEGENTQATGS